MKSNLVSPIIESIFKFVIFVFDAITANKSFVITKAVYMLTIIPAHKVTANPRIGPEPRINRITPTSSVVRLASRIVTNALSYPAVIAVQRRFPIFVSSLMRSKIKTFASTAIPMVSKMPAIPGRVNTGRDMTLPPVERPIPRKPEATIIPNGRSSIFSRSAIFATTPLRR